MPFHDRWKWSGEKTDDGFRGVGWENWAPGQPNNGQPDDTHGYTGHQDGSYMVMECSACRDAASKDCGDCSNPKCGNCESCNVGPGKTGRPCGSWNDLQTHGEANMGALCSHPAVDNGVGQNPCEGGFELEPVNEQRCYKAFPATGDAATSWKAAQAKCQALDGAMTTKKGVGLATITSADENAFVVSLLKKATSVPDTEEFAASIGCTDDQEEGVFVWSGEGNRPLMYTNWAPGEPNQDHDKDESICVLYGNDHHANGKSPTGSWNDDVETVATKAYVCSYRRACKPGFRLEPMHEKRCYKAVAMSDNTEWKTAQRRCRALVPSKGSDLATVTNQAENDFVLSLITDNAFIGCNDIKTEGTFVWSGEGQRPLCKVESKGVCTPLVGGHNVYMNWHSGEPNSYHSHNEDACAMYGPAPGNPAEAAGTWNDIPETGGSPATKEYVCSYRFACDEGYVLGPDPDPEGGGQQKGQRCFKFVNSPSTWSQARDACREDAPGRGSDLATITSKEENDFVLNLIRATPGWTPRSHWHSMLGCNDQQSEGVWKWSGENGRAICTVQDADGTCAPARVADGTEVFTNWARGEPDDNQRQNGVAADTCRMLDSDHNCGVEGATLSWCAGQWHDVVTTNHAMQGFTCSYLYGCGESALEYQLEPVHQQRCYKVIAQGPATTWEDAERACLTDYEAMSSNLATIVNNEENDFVRGLIMQIHTSAFIGCMNTASTLPGTWQWVGEGKRPVSYAHWAPNEPNDYHKAGINGEDKCAMYGGHFQPGFWNDVSASQPVNGVGAFVCSFRHGCSEEGYMLEPITQKRCYKRVSAAVSWNTAQNICRNDNLALGTDLATITSPQENVYVQSLITSSAWIGCNDIVKKGTWNWSGEGTRPLCSEAVVGTPPCVPATSNTYTNWKDGEPNSKSGSESTCQMYFRDGTWNDRAPAQDEAKVGEMVCSYSAEQQFWQPTKAPTNRPTAATKAPTPATVATKAPVSAPTLPPKQDWCSVSETQGEKCEAGWTLDTEGKNRCFQFFRAEPNTSWESARAQCRLLLPFKESDLATITSHSENEVVTSLVTSNSFIGCNDVKPVAVPRNT